MSADDLTTAKQMLARSPESDSTLTVAGLMEALKQQRPTDEVRVGFSASTPSTAKVMGTFQDADPIRFETTFVIWAPVVA